MGCMMSSSKFLPPFDTNSITIQTERCLKETIDSLQVPFSFEPVKTRRKDQAWFISEEVEVSGSRMEKACGMNQVTAAGHCL